MPTETALFTPLALPNGTVLKNRIVKSAMSDSLGDGRGNPTEAQMRLYERWAEGGAAVSIVGEVQGDPLFAEKPGNLVLSDASDLDAFARLARRGGSHGTQLWLQLGHAGALTSPEIGTPKGPSPIDLPALRAGELSADEIRALPDRFAETARRAEALGFSGVQVHAAHGFLLSQFLSPLFNSRRDAYGADIAKRMRLLLEVVEAVRNSVSSSFVVALKLNSSDQLEGGLEPEDSLGSHRGAGWTRTRPDRHQWRDVFPGSGIKFRQGVARSLFPRVRSRGSPPHSYSADGDRRFQATD